MTLRSSFLRHAVLPAVEAGTRARFWSIYKKMLADEDNGPGWAAVQQDRLQKLLDIAATTPLWSERLSAEDQRPARERLGDVPATEKATLRSRLSDLLNPAIPAADLRYNNSSGTTERITVVSDFNKRDSARASELRGMRRVTGLEVGGSTVEIPPDSCNALCGLEDPGPEGVLPYIGWAMRKGTLFAPATRSDIIGRFDRSLVHRRWTLEPLAPAPVDHLQLALDRILERIQHHRPRVVRALPHYLLWLADRARQRGLSFPKLVAVLPYGGLMSPVMGQRVAAGFGVPFRDLYGTSELGTIAASCPAGHLHSFDDLFVLEIDQNPTEEHQQQPGDLLVTDLCNHAMPLLRYRLGDVCERPESPCSCGSTMPRLIVHGRRQERINTATHPLHAREFCDMVYKDTGLWNARLEERRPGQFTFLYVAAPDENPDIEALCDMLSKRLGPQAELRQRAMPVLQPESSGKYRSLFPSEPVI